MLRIGNLSEVQQTRTLRVNYGNTQAYPFASNLDSNAYDIGGNSSVFNANGSGGTALGTGGNGPIWPGMVAALSKNGQYVCVAVGGVSQNAVPAMLPLGLFGNFVGGDFDETNYGGGYTEVGVWKGPGSWYEVLSPVFNSNINTNPGIASSRNLWWDGNGLLSSVSPGGAGSVSPIAYLGSYTPAKITLELLI